MLKSQAIELLGPDLSSAAEAVGISYQAVKKWPELLPPRISDRVLGVCVRNGIEVPAHFLKPNQPVALIPSAHTATKNEAQGVANGH